ncbi:LysR family transcriptional regulator [Pendulispora rubella]|uniref:LysR family transcriptional regulator n=1 Tax=Pendulispora rubella TaxID=2741070 RepID=A0ABZ2L5N1_9BACT
MPDLRLADIETFIAVCRIQSVSNVARQLGVTPSQVSKAVSRLERQFKMKLVDRRAGRSIPSAAGLRIAQRLDEVVGTIHALRSEDPFGKSALLTMASPSYLLGQCLPVLAQAMPQLRFRGVELPPSQIRGLAPEALFDMALTTGADGFGATWHVEQIGEMRSVLIGNPALVESLGTMPIPASKLADVPFITPTYTTQRAVFGDDECPLRVGERKLGHEVQTFGTGLELAVQCPQVVFGPILAARIHLERGLLSIIDVEGWDVRVPLFLASNQDNVKEATRRTVREWLANWLTRCG